MASPAVGWSHSHSPLTYKHRSRENGDDMVKQMFRKEEGKPDMETNTGRERGQRD